MNTEVILTIVGAIFASTGFWAFLSTLIQSRQSKTSNEAKLLRGIAHDRICYLGEKYIRQGWISTDDYENLHDYLYIPYHNLKGNGSAEKVMDEVRRLPLRRSEITIQDGFEGRA